MDQRDVAVVLASHGDRAGAEPNEILLQHAAALQKLIGLRALTAGVLKGEPSFEGALERAHTSGATEVIVYPLFMADGYFTNTVLRGRIRAAHRQASTKVLKPLGVDPNVADLVLDNALIVASQVSLDPQATRLLVVGHGSKFGRASADATRAAADRIAVSGRFGSVAVAFLEEAPFLEAALSETASATLVSGFFLGDGMHAGEDVPAAIDRAGARATYMGPVGRSPGIARLIAGAIRAETPMSAV